MNLQTLFNTLKKQPGYLLIAYIPLSLFIDMATGLTLPGASSIGTIGQLLKGLVLLAIFLFFLTGKQKVRFLIPASVVVFFTLVQQFGHFSRSTLLADLIFDSKILSVYCFTLAFSTILTTTLKTSTKPLFIATLTASIIIGINIALGFFGTGNLQYLPFIQDGVSYPGFGYKGFFLSGNELSAAIVLYTGITSYFLVESGLALAFAGYLTIAAVLDSFLGMKTALIGTLSHFILVPASQLVGKPLKIWISTARTYALPVLVSFCIIVPTFLYASHQNSIAKRYESIQTRDGDVSAVVGNRQQYAKDALELYAQKFSVTEKVFGVGYTRGKELLAQQDGGKKDTVEVDLIDLLLYYGIGALVYYFIWVLLIVRFLYTGKQTSNWFPAYTNVLLFSISLFAGHIVYSSLVGLAWGICTAYGLSLQRKYAQKTKIIWLGTLAQGGIRTYMQETAKVLGTTYDITVIGTHRELRAAKNLYYFITAIVKTYTLMALWQIQGYRVIVHLHSAAFGSFLRKFIILLLVSPFADKVILHLHAPAFPDFIKHNPKLAILFRWFFTIPDVTIFVSHALLTEVTQALKPLNVHLTPSKMNVIYNAIHYPKSEPIRPKQEKDHIVTIIDVARLHPEKNPLSVVDIAALLKKETTNFVINMLGDGYLRKELEEKIHQEHLEAFVKVLGWVEPKQRDKLLAKSDIFLLPSIYESFGYAIVEANLFKLPAVATCTGGIPEVIKNGETGFIFPIGDSQQAAKYLLKLINDTKLREEMGEKAFHWVKQFSFETIVPQLAQLYDT